MSRASYLALDEKTPGLARLQAERSRAGQTRPPETLEGTSVPLLRAIADRLIESSTSSAIGVSREGGAIPDHRTESSRLGNHPISGDYSAPAEIHAGRTPAGERVTPRTGGGG